ncbi:amine oxidase [Aspergillus floccosus]
MHIPSKYGLLAASAIQACSGYVAQPRGNDATCKSTTKTTVAILGGGMAGVTAAQALTNASVTDFLILEYRDTLGGRMWHTDFGKDENGDPFTIEFGANWVQGIGSNTTENPIWHLAKKHNLKNHYSNYDSILTYDEHGYVDFQNVLDEYDEASEKASQEAGRLLVQNVQDMTARSGFALAGWNPGHDDMKAQAVEWWNWDWEDAWTPETSSFIFGMAGENLTFNQFGEDNNLAIDQRGFSVIVTEEAKTFLKPKQVRLNTEVTQIDHSSDGVTIHTKNGDCVRAAYAICTFSVGVLQRDVIKWEPELPLWKRTAIQKFEMGTYTKIFLQFNETFWPEDKEYFLYASPTTRGYYPVWQSLSTEGFFPGSNIIFVTVVQDQAYRAELQSDEETKEEVMAVLREMFPDKNVPDPIAFKYPRWTSVPWAYGSYSNWPVGTTLEVHQNLRANVDRVWFAGEAISAQYFGFLQGAWFEGREAGMQVAGLLQDRCVNIYGDRVCGQRVHYDPLQGTTPIDAYTLINGWPVDSIHLE